jgi:hypothetical protein
VFDSVPSGDSRLSTHGLSRLASLLQMGMIGYDKRTVPAMGRALNNNGTETTVHSK